MIIKFDYLLLERVTPGAKTKRISTVFFRIISKILGIGSLNLRLQTCGAYCKYMRLNKVEV